MQYSVKRHAHRLSLMLKRGAKTKEGVGVLCPGDYFEERYRQVAPGQYEAVTMVWDNDKCEVCRSFIGMGPEDVRRPFKGFDHITVSCPCVVLGEEEALRRTEKALEEYYANN